MKRQLAFTLTEILVAIAIMGVMALFGFASYSRFMDRSVVENTGKELITFIRTAQMRSRSGDRGTGACLSSIDVIAAGSSKLNGWRVDLSATGATSYPVCTVSGSTMTGDKLSTKPFESGIKLYCSATSTCSNYIYTKSVFGDTWYNATSQGSTSDQNSHIFVVTDGTNNYRFVLANGSVSNGSFCAPLADCFSGTVTNME